MAKTKTGRRSLARVAIPYKLPDTESKKTLQMNFKLELLELELLGKIESEKRQEEERNSRAQKELPVQDLAAALELLAQEFPEATAKDKVVNALKEEIQKFALE